MSLASGCSLIYMGRLIYGFNVSVDGYIADAQGSIDWSEPSEELHQYWNDFERETALSFYGRRLYELMSAYWPTADADPDAAPMIVDFARIWRAMPKVVFSRTLDSVDWNARLERGDPVEVVTKLKAETDGNLEVAGATLAARRVVGAGEMAQQHDRREARRPRRILGERQRILHPQAEAAHARIDGDMDAQGLAQACDFGDGAGGQGRDELLGEGAAGGEERERGARRGAEDDHVGHFLGLHQAEQRLRRFFAQPGQQRFPSG
mgnify:CR=1 FL=1